MIGFPSSPSLNQVFSNNAGTWAWDGVVWKSISETLKGSIAVIDAGGGANSQSLNIGAYPEDISKEVSANDVVYQSKFQTISNKVIEQSTLDSPTINDPTIISPTIIDANLVGGIASMTGTRLSGTREGVTIIPTAISGQQNIDLATSSFYYYTANATANFSFNFRGSATATLDSIMNIGESITCAIFVACGATAYYATNGDHKIDGVSFTPKWSAGQTPISGNANSIDVYSYTIVKTGAASFLINAVRSFYA